jgi:stalled ribosome rescue protein Dom34
MSLSHAVVWTDHQTAQVLQFDAAHVEAHKIRAKTHYTRQHESGVRTQHEFFSEVCGALDGIQEVLIAGSHTAIADFRHYAEKHRPHVAALITGYEVVDHPTDNQLVALARQYFLKHDRMRGVTNPF